MRGFVPQGAKTILRDDFGVKVEFPQGVFAGIIKLWKI
jgi:hypothetical protein